MVLKYSKATMSRFMDPKYAKEMPDADAVGEEGNFKCGDIMRIYIKVNNHKIYDISFLTYGCVAAIASTEMLCEMVKGMDLDEAEKLTPKDIIQKLEDVPKIKHHCSIMGTFALKKAIENYKKQKLPKKNEK